MGGRKPLPFAPFVYARGTVEVLPKLLPQFLRQLYDDVCLFGRLLDTANHFECLLCV